MKEGHKDGGCRCITQTLAIEKTELAVWETARELAINSYRLALPAYDWKELHDATRPYGDDEPVQTVATSFPASKTPTKPSLSCHASSLRPLQQERASSMSPKTYCPINVVSNTDTGSIKQAINQSNEVDARAAQAMQYAPAEDPRREISPTDCENPLGQSSNTRPAEHKAFAAGRKRWPTSETSIRSVRPEPRAGNSTRVLAQGGT
jgi:hypothetical protein